MKKGTQRKRLWHVDVITDCNSQALPQVSVIVAYTAVWISAMCSHSPLILTLFFLVSLVVVELQYLDQLWNLVSAIWSGKHV